MLTTQATGETYRRKYSLYTSIKIQHNNLEKIKFDSEENLLDENTIHGFVSSITIRKTIPTPINLLRIIRPTLFTQPSLGYNPNRDEDCGAILR
jgi:hypothetical protein